MPRIDKHQVAAAFSGASARYDEFAPLQRRVGRELFAYGNAVFKQANTLLDLGCGTGFLHELYRQSAGRGAFWQLDFSEAMCAVAKAYQALPAFGAGGVICADMETLPLADNSVDVVMSSMAMHWSDDIAALLAEVRRVLVRDGKMVIAVPLQGSLCEVSQSFEAVGAVAPINGFPEMEALETYVSDAGFDGCEKEIMILDAPCENLLKCLKEMKQIGAHIKQVDKPVSAVAMRQANYYFTECYQEKVTWKIGFIIASNR